MLHLARCAPYLTKDHPLDAAIAHRRGDLIRAAFIGYRQRHEIESGKFSSSKEWRAVEQPRSPKPYQDLALETSEVKRMLTGLVKS